MTKLLRACKAWSGPVTSGEELRQCLSGRDDQQHVLRTEMSYYAHTHKAERIANRDLYRLNGISFQEMLENLTILLQNVDDCGSTATTANLPTNSDVLKALAKHNCETTFVPAVEDEFTKVNQMCAVLWQEDGGYQWYLGYVKEVSQNGQLLVDHLARVSSDSKWKYPSHEDVHVQEMDPEQIVPCEIKGKWDMATNLRKSLFSGYR